MDLGYFTQDQSLLEGQASDVIQDIRTKTARVEVFHFDQSVGVDYEDYVSDFASYERSSVFASSSIPIADALSLHTTGNTFTTRFKDGSGREHGSSVSANLSAQPLSNMLLDLRGEWHKLDLRADNGTGYLADGRALYRWRKLSFELLVRLSDERFDVAGSQRTLHTMLTVSRKF